MGKLYGKETLYRQEIMSVIRKGYFNSESNMKINIFEKGNDMSVVQSPTHNKEILIEERNE